MSHYARVQSLRSKVQDTTLPDAERASAQTMILKLFTKQGVPRPPMPANPKRDYQFEIDIKDIAEGHENYTVDIYNFMKMNGGKIVETTGRAYWRIKDEEVANICAGRMNAMAAEMERRSFAESFANYEPISTTNKVILAAAAIIATSAAIVYIVL